MGSMKSSPQSTEASLRSVFPPSISYAIIRPFYSNGTYFKQEVAYDIEAFTVPVPLCRRVLSGGGGYSC